MSSDCIFCKIIRGEIPSTRVYEDDQVLAFLDIGPIIKGHTLVIPKQHTTSLLDTPDTALGPLLATVRRVALALTTALGAEGFNVTQANGACAGQVVPHLHFHVIPRFTTDGHSWNWNAKRYDTPEEMTALGARIRASLEHLPETLPHA